MQSPVNDESVIVIPDDNKSSDDPEYHITDRESDLVSIVFYCPIECI